MTKKQLEKLAKAINNMSNGLCQVQNAISSIECLVEQVIDAETIEEVSRD